MYSIPVWRGPRGAMEPEDRVRVDAAIESAETINARIGLRAQDTPGKQTTHASSSAAFKIVFLYIRLTFR